MNKICLTDVDDLFSSDLRDPKFANQVTAEMNKLISAVAVRKERENCGWTQQELAERSGVLQSMIARVEKGANISMNTISKITNVFGKSVKWWMKYRRCIFGLMAVMVVGVLTGCSGVASNVKPATSLVASSKNSEQAWIDTYGLKGHDPVDSVLVFKGNKVAIYGFPLGAKLSEFEGLSNIQLIKKAKYLN
ncbi:XRE family transcriptional regulator [Levilactobacillus brevis]|jgi:DNA-binding XRE family transcriptional regulator|nr:XRE family transcriptional regulator [Levilactobacillus brevis]